MLNWQEIKTENPEIDQIVILSSEKVTDFKKWTLAQFLESDDKSKFIYFIHSEETRESSSYLYWTPFLIKDLGIPLDYQEEELPRYLYAFKEILRSYEQRFMLMFRITQISGEGLYHLDFYLNGTYSRALSLIEGFIVLLESKNYMAASHLVRPYLDNFLRLFAAWLVENPHDFANEVMKGKKVEEFFDKENAKQKLRDWYLRDRASEEYPWIKDVYNTTSGYIHFSRKHIFNPIVEVNINDFTIGSYLSKYDSKTVTDLNRIEAVLVMIEISNCILEYAYGWARTKSKKI
ncbi:hypothetical protein [Mongoliitalea daihaiensis]|uniref:hypothetical protein n=1 Tax=Mongoliitalea daihaiensis TaxID=2782006 RepID=UPI001F21C7ED|nr:hypothetical protein [Mongoliitalea daihaiensis]UJP65166.1 hypothetical protein IPZ59_00575 [Mongoliitalea daihaiensis]